MTATNTQGLQAKQGLTPDEITAIEQLAALCNEHDGIELKLNYDTLKKRPTDAINDFFYYENGKLVGFLPLFVFNTREAEVSGMVHPEYRRQGIFTKLVEAGLTELKKRNIPNTIFIVHTQANSGKEFVKTVGADYSFSEYLMKLDQPIVREKAHPTLTLERATTEHGEFMALCMSVSFNIPLQDVNWFKFNEDNRHYYVVKLDGELIGSLATRVDEHESFIYGFGIMPDYQGRGYGRQILGEVIQNLLAQGQTNILLEVAAKNDHALGLYRSVGFEVTNGYDYYTRPTED